MVPIEINMMNQLENKCYMANISQSISQFSFWFSTTEKQYLLEIWMNFAENWKNRIKKRIGIELNRKIE